MPQRVEQGNPRNSRNSILPRLLPAAPPPCGAITAESDTPTTIAVSVYCFRNAPGIEDVHLQAAADSYTKVELSTDNRTP